MKNLYILCSLMLLCCAFENAFAQNPKELNPGYYVVVSAYAPTRENVAQNYTEVLNRRGMKATYGFNSQRNFYYVYLNFFSDLKQSLASMQELRKQEEFAKAWVRVIPGNLATTPPVSLAPQTTIQETKKTESTRPVVIKTEPEVAIEKVVTTPPEITTSVADTTTSDITDNPEIVQYKKITLENTEVFLSLFNARNNRIVEGNVKVIDSEKSKLIKEVKGNDYLYLPDPGNKSGMVTLICEAFGYRKVQQEINYPLPIADTVKEYIDLMGTTFIVSFDLVRYQAGDIATLYNVYFYNDAAVMLPESKYELNSLLQMMEEDPSYRVRLHGHTNGNYHGKIILMGTNKNFFSLTGSKNSVGSAKDLARGRAEIIKEYLVTNGIDGGRIEVKSWGGKKPIYDRHSANAKKNVRVEVEVLKK